MRKADFLPLIEKLDNRLAGWKGLLLSRGGRLVLLNSVLSGIPAFFCSVFLLPAWAAKAVDKIRRGFFWKGEKSTNGLHCLVKWEQVCRPKRFGGIGIRNIRSTNAALLMKGLWNFYNSKSLPWVRLLRQKHYKRSPPSLASELPSRCCPLWKGILSTKGAFLSSAHFLLGDGSSLSFWHTGWNGEPPLCSRFPTLFASATHQQLSIKCWLLRFASRRNLGFRHPLSAEGTRELDQLDSLVQSLSLLTQSNTVAWRWRSNEGFSVRDAYNFLSFDGVDDRKITNLWSIRIPLRIKIFCGSRLGTGSSPSTC